MTRLKKSGKYVLIHGSQWQGEQDSAENDIIKERLKYSTDLEKKMILGEVE